MNAEGSEQRKADIFDIEHTLKEIADVAADLLSRCFELLDFEALNKESERNSVPSDASEVSEDFPVLRGLPSEASKTVEQGSIANIPASAKVPSVMKLYST